MRLTDFCWNLQPFHPSQAIPRLVKCVRKLQVAPYFQKGSQRYLQCVLCPSASVQSLSRVRLFATPWTAACQASLSFTNSWSLLKLMSIKSVMPSNHLILCCSLLLLPLIFPSSIRVFSNESVPLLRQAVLISAGDTFTAKFLSSHGVYNEGVLGNPVMPIERL